MTKKRDDLVAWKVEEDVGVSFPNPELLEEIPWHECFLENIYNNFPESRKSNDYNFDNLEKITDYIFDKIDEAFCNGQFNLVDAILPQIDFEKLNPTLLISLLCITLAAKSKLNNRNDFYLKVEEHFLRTRGIEKTERLLKNLK